MAAPAPAGLVRWYRSLYFRIGFGFVAFVVGLLLLQGLFLGIGGRPPLRATPNTLAALVAADVTAALADNPSVDIDVYLKRQYAQSQPIYVVMRNGVTAANVAAPLAEDLQRYAMEVLEARSREVQVSSVPTPFVTAPIRTAEALAGIVVLPPAPMPNPMVRDLQRLTSPPSTVVLVILTIAAAVVIFEPARRRMQALRLATQRLGAGDLTARAPVSGSDEVAELSAAFNRMAAELSERNHALQRSDQLRRQMLADVSHELKTPLTAMRGYVETLHREDVSLDDVTRERYFQTLERETERLDRIVKDLLDLARLENGVVDLDVRVFAIRRLFEHVVARHERDTQRRHVEAYLHVDDAADQMVADPNRIEQLVENLFANALRHVPDGGRIDLGARLHDQAYVLTVEDSGSGIDEAHAPHVFERFYKVNAARSNGSGSGLGLSISKAIVERHSGTIAVESVPGRTVFTMRFPLETGSERTTA